MYQQTHKFHFVSSNNIKTLKINFQIIIGFAYSALSTNFWKVKSFRKIKWSWEC